MAYVEALFDTGGGEGLVISDFVDWNVVESATSLDPNSYQGGSPQITLTVLYDKYYKRLNGKSCYFSHDTYGTLIGRVRNVTGQGNMQMTIVIDHTYALLNSYQELPPLSDSYTFLGLYYFASCGMAPPQIPDNSVANLNIDYPGNQDNLYDIMKQSLAAEQLQMRGQGNDVYIEKRNTDIKRIDNYISQPDWNADTQETSRKVRIHYYHNEEVTSQQIYPTARTNAEIKLDPDDVTDEPTVYSVDANEVLEVDIETNVSLYSVENPICLDYVSPITAVGSGTSNPFGVYCVVGNDGLPITAAQWVGTGGNIEATTDEDYKVVHLTITGSANTIYAPYRIAASSGSGNYYNTLKLVGSGVSTNDDFIDLHTGGQDSLTGEELGAEVTNPYISTLSQAVESGQHTAGAQALNMSLSGGNFVNFSDGSAGFGTVAGQRIESNAGVYRIMNVTFSPSGINFTAQEDTLIQEFDSVYSGMSMSEFNDMWSGALLQDFSMSPLEVGIY